MRDHAGEYKSLWMNINDASNIDILKMAYRCGIPRRIVHMHNNSIPDVAVTKVFHSLNRFQCVDMATVLLGLFGLCRGLPISRSRLSRFAKYDKSCGPCVLGG